MGCRGRSKFCAQEQQEHETKSKTQTFEKKEREEEEGVARGACEPQAPVWRSQGLGRATWPPSPGVDPPGQPQVPPGGFLHGNFYFKFSGIFRTTSL